MPTSPSTPSMETSVASMRLLLIFLLAISSQLLITTDAKLGSRTSVLNAPKDGTSTRKESVVKSLHSAVSSTEPKESVKNAIKDTPLSTIAVKLQNKILDVLNGMAMSAKDVQRGGG